MRLIFYVFLIIQLQNILGVLGQKEREKSSQLNPIKWEKVNEDTKGNTFYVDFERIRKHHGYVYWWQLVNYRKRDKWGFFSYQLYNQGDCNVIRVKTLTFVFHKKPMGGDIGRTEAPIGKNGDWRYPSPYTVDEAILRSLCSR